jgi:ABC-type uncharacterized transport system ATPase subunit
VLREGRVTDRLVTSQTDPAQIIRAMIGRNVTAQAPATDREPGAVRLRVDRLLVGGHHRRSVDNVSLEVRGGEILGVAGVAGNGQSELVEAIMGLTPVAGGSVSVNGSDITQRSIIERRGAGVSYIAEDRIRTASVGAASATDNLTMGFHRKAPIAVRGLLRPKQARAWARTLISKFDIRIASESTLVRTLSGGNLQKVVIARELAHNAPVLIAEQPTRGVDVGAIEFIHAQLMRERDRGHAILLVSAELSEILSLSDRIVVMYEGRLVAQLRRAEANEAKLGMYMAGGAAPKPP